MPRLQSQIRAKPKLPLQPTHNPHPYKPQPPPPHPHTCSPTAPHAHHFHHTPSHSPPPCPRHQNVTGRSTGHTEKACVNVHVLVAVGLVFFRRVIVVVVFDRISVLPLRRDVVSVSTPGPREDRDKAPAVCLVQHPNWRPWGPGP